LTKKGTTPQVLEFSDQERVNTIVAGPSNLIYNSRGAISAKSVGINSKHNTQQRFRTLEGRKASGKATGLLKKRLILIGQIQTGDRGRTKKKDDYILEIKQAKNEVMM
jgi:hypothetical protein